ncbi:hypothetical protein DTL70_07845 [Streptomyces diacarni]|uniref:Uncharacterized protein n=1 Tax=Streptomyces diacarni TaxID=2800381 RepID=A0A367F8E3_9ACTN|nr:hypothetical protein [Streptomyces diacarni]RCG25985.1 hypothetical protein DTL70_07845 [Streptomyces diacarni]
MERERASREQCLDCEWYRTQINRAAGDPEPRADLEALFGAHLRHKHSDGERGDGERGEAARRRPLRSV